MQAHFQSKVVSSSEKAGLVYLVNAEAKGKPAWYYIQVDEPKHNAFKKQMKEGNLNLADYGKILYSGWGTTPPDVIQALVQEKYSTAA